jgi:stage II sporulation protein M
MIIEATALTFFGVIVVSIFLTLFAFAVAPGLSEWLESLMQSERSYIAIPPPYTENLYFYILLNNAGHFWNPIRMLVWVPLFGTFVLGFELLFNGVVIGVVSTIVGMNRGISYPILGLVPHGIFEIPAFILEFASIICWHIAAIEIIMTKVIGEKVNGAKFKRGVKDAVILALASLILFVIAAFVETYVTPRLLGL